MKFLMIGILTMTLFGCIGSGQNSPISAQNEKTFPGVTGIDLEGKDRQLPAAFSGRKNLVAVAFEREHQDAVNTWIPFAESQMASDPDVRFYEVPLIYEMMGITRMWVNNGMRSGIPDPAARERTITVYTDRDVFTKALNMSTDRIYMLLVDDTGKILWRAEGPRTDALEKSLKAALKK